MAIIRPIVWQTASACSMTGAYRPGLGHLPERVLLLIDRGEPYKLSDSKLTRTKLIDPETGTEDEIVRLGLDFSSRIMRAIGALEVFTYDNFLSDARTHLFGAPRIVSAIPAHPVAAASRHAVIVADPGARDGTTALADLPPPAEWRPELAARFRDATPCDRVLLLAIASDSVLTSHEKLVLGPPIRRFIEDWLHLRGKSPGSGEIPEPGEIARPVWV